MNLVRDYTRWLHTRWPAGSVEKLPQVEEDGTTTMPGVRVVGDLTGIPLLKFSVDSGVRAVRAIIAEPGFKPGSGDDETLDLAIVGGGVSGIAAAIEANKSGLKFKVYEASSPFSTVVNFPKGKPIYTYPTNMTPAGDLTLTADVKEDLVDELERQRLAAGVIPVKLRITRLERKGKTILLHHESGAISARRVIVAIGRSGNMRKLGVPGEDLGKVCNRLHDPNVYQGKSVLVVGGGDSALETSIALVLAGANVTHSYRGEAFNRPKPDNIEKLNKLAKDSRADVSVEEPTSERVATAFTSSMRGPHSGGSIRLALHSQVAEIGETTVVLKENNETPVTIPNDAVFVMIGREAPLGFFRRSGIPIRGEWRAKTYVGFALFFLFCVGLYHWKSNAGIPIHSWFRAHGWFPFNVPAMFDALGGALAESARAQGSLLHTLKRSMGEPSFYYTLAYCTCVVVFGIRRIKRRRTPYVKAQTLTLMAIQCIPLFILPELLLPWAGRNGWFADGMWASVADQFFERYDEAGFERAYWRSYGFILAWPLFVWNAFTERPLWGWLVVGFIQTFVIIPLIIRRWGKGAYCGWICPCGALAETLGDAHRQKMPHGPFWNRLNMVGQVILALALVIMLLRILGWVFPASVFPKLYVALASGIPLLNYKWFVDLMLAGVVGVACYFWFSGRVWCRFACPLAALMHIYARYTKFRIFADKPKCISCNVCTSMCHQGIDVMSFANKGLPMEDPECVRCSACVQSCPTGVLSFGRYANNGEIVHDRLAASPVLMAEEKMVGK